MSNPVCLSAQLKRIVRARERDIARHGKAGHGWMELTSVAIVLMVSTGFSAYRMCKWRSSAIA